MRMSGDGPRSSLIFKLLAKGYFYLLHPLHKGSPDTQQTAR
jgi:hypothetical protein